MRILHRSAQTFWYRLYEGVAPKTIPNTTLETGENAITYGSPVAMRANISPASGASMTEQFGTMDNYDKVIVTDDMTCPIDENTVLYIDAPPVIDYDTGKYNPYDYVVMRVAKSINSISIAVRKVNVS